MAVLTREQIIEALERLDAGLGARGTVSMADERTLLAMKCAAARTSEDANDIRALADRLRLGTRADVLAVVTQFYPDDRLPVRTRLLIEELFP